MGQPPPSTRRDPRRDLPAGDASVEFEVTGSEEVVCRAEVVSVSATGLAFVQDSASQFQAGSILTSVRVLLPEGVVEGDLAVRYAWPTSDSRFEYGCLFYPASIEQSGHWRLAVKGVATPESPPPQLPFRCSNCHGANWVAADGRSDHRCAECEQEFHFARSVLKSGLAGLHLRAGGMARELGIDLPSAVSMVLGLLTLPEVRDILDRAPQAESMAPAQGAARNRKVDRAFDPAIAAGTLTPAQAVQRGNRETFVRKLIARHRISLEEAYAVADNRTSLLTVIRNRKAGQPITARCDRPAPARRVLAVAAVNLIVLTVGLGVVIRPGESSGAPRLAPVPRQADFAVNRQATGLAGPTAAAATERPAVAERSVEAAVEEIGDLPVESYARVDTDARGTVLRVEATDPRNVLVAFCRSSESSRLQPIDVQPTEPPSETTRLGLLRDLDRPDGYRVVFIRRDAQTRRWFVGDPVGARAPVPMLPASDLLIRVAEARP